MAILDRRAGARSPDQAALLHRLGQSARSAHLDADLNQLAGLMAGPLREMATKAYAATAMAMTQLEVDEIGMNVAGIEIALAGARWAPDPARGSEAADRRHRGHCARAHRLGVGAIRDRRCRQPVAVQRRGAVRARHRCDFER